MVYAARVALTDTLTDRTEIELGPLRVAGLALVPAAVLLSVSPYDPVPPCPLRTLTGIPCPLCGSTRGVIAAVHGHPALRLTIASCADPAVAASEIEHGDPAKLLALQGLDAPGIQAAIARHFGALLAPVARAA